MSDAPRPFDASLRLAQAGKGSGFDALYHHLAPRIQGFAIARRANDPDAITNEVMLRMFRRIADFSGDEADFAAWGFAIARNLLIDAHRAEARRPKVAEHEVPDGSTTSAEHEALSRLGNDRVQALLDRLTPDQRDVITMRILSDLSLEQTATAMGKPVSAVKRLQARAMRQLRKNISDEAVS